MKRYLILFFISTLCTLSTYVSAGMVISGTRVIYPAESKEVTVKMTNDGKAPVLVQSWIDTGDVNAKPETIHAPFVLTPPINRVDPGKGQTLRLVYTGENLPDKKESLFYLNVLEIPAKNKTGKDDNYLQVAFRTRIKLFFRPQGLVGDANTAAEEIQWSSAGNVLNAKNPTAYFISLATISVNGKEVEGKMIAPGSTEQFSLPSRAGNKINVAFVNDYGAVGQASSIIK